MRELKGLCRYWPGDEVMFGRSKNMIKAVKVVWDPLAEVRGRERILYDLGEINNIPEEDLHPVRMR